MFEDRFSTVYELITSDLKYNKTEILKTIARKKKKQDLLLKHNGFVIMSNFFIVLDSKTI